MRILLLDNYDSFTYNLHHYLNQFCSTVDVARNDEISIEQVADYDKIVISPGPGLPADSGITMAVLDQYANLKPILGVCLGFQAIIEHFGGSLKNLNGVLHGKSSKCSICSDDILFNGLPEVFEVGHYHSWVADELEIPDELVVTSLNESGLIMSVRHSSLPVNGVQFHPESVMTQLGLKMIENWIRLS